MLARFISADTIVPMPFYPQSLNRYAYAYNNPVVLRDLNGHWGESIGAFFSSIWSGIRSAWGGIQNFGGWAWGGIRSGARSVHNFVKNNIVKPIQSAWKSTFGRDRGTGSGVSPGNVMYAANTNGNVATDAWSGASRTGNANGSSLLFNGENIYWFNSQGEPINEYPAISGPFGNGGLPEGSYVGDNLRIRNDKAMTCPSGGWSLDLTPNFQTDRTLLRIHPDGNKPGTKGCIGVACSSSGQLYNDLRNYFKSGNSSIPVIINYNLRVNLGERK